MERLAVDNVMQLFPKIDGDASKFLLFLVSVEKRSNEIPFVKVMEKVQFLGLKNEFLPDKIDNFFEKKVDELKWLEVMSGYGQERVFDYIEKDGMNINYSFTEFFFQWGF